MKKALLAVVALECALLVGGLGAFALGGLDRFQRAPRVEPFRPPIHEARMDDLVRYERRDAATGRVLGYLEYVVKSVFVPEGTTIGRIIGLSVKETDLPRGLDTKPRVRERLMRVQPRTLAHGFLPPRFDDEDDYPAGERPVVSRISTATFRLRELPKDSPLPPPPPVHGFLVEAVVPRKSLTEVAERYWMTDKVPVFGVARWEREGEVLVLLHMERKG